MLDLTLMKKQQRAPVLGTRVDLAGSQPFFPKYAGDELATSLPIANFRQKRLLLGELQTPGQVHIFSADCRAGERLRVQMLAPVLIRGAALAPAFAVVAQSLPYCADVRKLPFELPAGFSAVVAPPPSELVAPVQDMLTQVSYFSGPVIDTRTLVGGRCYIIVWSPQNRMGKYTLQIGYTWPMHAFYWLQLPRYWWQIRGWFGMSRAAVFAVGAALGGLLVGGLLLALWQRKHSQD